MILALKLFLWSYERRKGSLLYQMVSHMEGARAPGTHSTENLFAVVVDRSQDFDLRLVYLSVAHLAEYRANSYTDSFQNQSYRQSLIPRTILQQLK